MLKILLVLLVFSMVAQTTIVQANHDTIAVLKGKQAVEQGICYVKGNSMINGGKETPCVLFTNEKQPNKAWFAVLQGDKVVQVFEATLSTGKTQLVWALGQVNI